MLVVELIHTLPKLMYLYINRISYQVTSITIIIIIVIAV